VIKERVEGKVEGTLNWCDKTKSQTKIQGEVTPDTIKFEECQLLQGNGVVPFPNSYEGKIDVQQSTILGTWTYSDQQGQFLLRLDLDNVQKAVEEKATSPHMDPKAYQVSEHAVISGFLIKQGKLRKTWKSRFFVLENSMMSYYSNRESYPTKPSGKIDLKNVTSVHEKADSAQKVFLFEITAYHRTYLIQAETASQRTEWIESLKVELRKLGKVL